MQETSSAASALVGRATALVPMLRSCAEAAERDLRVSPDVLDALAEAGIFRMMAPIKYGGQEASFQTQADVLSEVARGCAATSWVATIYSAMTWLAAVFPDETQEEILGDRDPRISGVFSPTGRAVRKDGGLVVTGKWPFNTGGHGSRWTVLVALVEEGGPEPVPTCLIARSSDLRRLGDWHASGMAATGSDTVVAEEVFVPARRALPLPDLVEANHPLRHNSGNPYFGLPLAPVLAGNAVGTPLGVARAAYENFFERLPGRGISYTFYTSKAEAPVTHLQVGEADLKIASADAHARLSNAILDNHSGQALSVEARVKVRAHVSYATGLAREAVDQLFFASGASSIQSHIPIQRCQRDIQALANHAVLHPATTLELYGRVLCGLPPNSPLY